MKCVQTQNVWGKPLNFPCDGSGVRHTTDSDRHRSLCKTGSKDRCLVHVYEPEDEFVTFVRKVLDEQTL